jgi:hypothetical protein
MDAPGPCHYRSKTPALDHCRASWQPVGLSGSYDIWSSFLIAPMPAKGRRFVGPVRQLLPNGRPVLLQIVAKLIDRHAVDARATFVAPPGWLLAG